ncbi:MAG TPA: M1 family metallopeptidase [Thermoanaerobaculia bacterium]|jgi:alanyl aminopeptidase|nr:M1 family metallopeptidase [Thermoanaerobaculia bacterium]
MKRALSILLLLALSPLLAGQSVRLGTDVAPVRQSIRLELDPRLDTFRGSVDVELNVERPTRTFRFHAQDLSVVSLRLSKAERPIDAAYSAGEGNTVNVTAGERLTPGAHYALHVDFTNKYNRQAVGLYKMTTKDAEPYLFSQFEAIDARRAFPVWDEPHFKIPYQLTVAVPSQYDAVSNTPVDGESASGDVKTVRFARTKPLPSYLIALAVGRFDYTPIEGLGVPGRVVAPKGQGRLAGMAAQITPPVLAALEKYFGGRYPFEKVDLIAVPEYWAGAMENPGAITYRDTVLLLDPSTATPAQRQNLVRVTAHELAHMWFGDLVTMEWWNDLWLNESFADWMGDKITDQVFPEFEHAISELGGIQGVMGSDARGNADPIRRKESTPEESMRAVGLAYNKGKAVLSMFEQWIGPAKFREGVLAHLKANAWSNATAEEFFGMLAKHAPAGTAEAMETFIAQPGIPLVTVERVGPNSVRLTQQRFTTSGDAKPVLWKIPVTLRYDGGTKAVLLDAPSKTVTLDVPRAEWIYPHAQAAGYYRWRMSDDELALLARRAPDVLEPRERLAFIGNLAALFRSGTLHGDTYLHYLEGFAADPDPHVAGALLGTLANVRSTFLTPETRPRFASYLRRTLGPMVDRIGLTPRPGESHSVASLRPELVAWLGEYGDDPRIQTFAREQLAKYMQDPKSIDPALIGVIISLGGVHGDAALFAEYRRRFENASTPAERSRFLGGMRQFEDPAIKKQVRDYALNGPVRPTEIMTLVSGAEDSAQRDELFQWVTSNYDALMKKLPPTFGSGMAALAGGCEPERVERARQFLAEKKVQGYERGLTRTAEAVNECAALRAREIEAITRYLSAQQ